MDTTKFKSVSIDIETYDILAKVAEHECRSIGGQIQWLIKQMPMLADLRPMTPAVPVKRKKKEVSHKCSAASARYTMHWHVAICRARL